MSKSVRGRFFGAIDSFGKCQPSNDFWGSPNEVGFEYDMGVRLKFFLDFIPDPWCHYEGIGNFDNSFKIFKPEFNKNIDKLEVSFGIGLTPNVMLYDVLILSNGIVLTPNLSGIKRIAGTVKGISASPWPRGSYNNQNTGGLSYIPSSLKITRQPEKQVNM